MYQYGLSLIFGLLLLLATSNLEPVCSFVIRTSVKRQTTSRLEFKVPRKGREDEGNNDDVNSNVEAGGGFWGNLKRFLPLVTQAKLDKSFAKEVPDGGNRYHVRLINPDPQLKRHTITRITRFFPDISWQRAEQIYNKANSDGTALIQIMTSQVIDLRSNYIVFYNL